MKKSNLFLSLFLALFVSITLTSCGPKDAAIKAEIEKVLASNPDMKNMIVTVEKGIATVSCECKDDACKSTCESAIKAVKGVKEVVMNCTITPPPVTTPAVEIAPVNELEGKVTDALKDFPGIKFTLQEKSITLTGEVEKAKLAVVMQALQALNLKVDSKGLTKK